MDDFKNRIKRAQYWFNEAEYVVIGAGAGLSEAAGFHYSGQRFEKYFYNFKKKYAINDMYTGSFYQFETEEEKWAYWAQMIQCNVYDTQPTDLYQGLLEWVKSKDYFVVTTNTDNQFAINGVDMNKYFEVQGNFIYLQCHKGCYQKVYYNQELISQMVTQTKDCKIAVSLIPKCPKCNGKMDVHVRKDCYFVETPEWHQHSEKYNDFLNKVVHKKVVFLEFGVGFNTPSIIRYPFEKMVYHNENAHLIRFNKDYAFSLPGNEDNVVSFEEDILQVLNCLKGSI